MDPTVLMLGVSGLIFYLMNKRKKKGAGDEPLPPPPPPDDDDREPPPTPGGGDRPGDSDPDHGRVPKTRKGGKRFGDVTKDYMLPKGWDPIRGIWFSPDCEVVVESPGWLCGQEYDGVINMYPGSPNCKAIEFTTYKRTMAEPYNGCMGYVDYLINKGFNPSEVAWTILEEAAPHCWNKQQRDWPPGLVYWWNYLLSRLAERYEENTGIHFDPFAQS